MQTIVLLALVLGFVGPILYVVLSLIGDRRAIKAASTHEARAEQRSRAAQELSWRLDVINRMYNEGMLNIEQYEDLVLYVQCGGRITSDGGRAGISNEGYARLLATRRRFV